MNNNYGVKNFDTIFAYNTKAGSFDGPLDLLLYLVKEAQIEIRDIFMSEVTEQFIAYIEENELSLEETGDYLAVAVALLYEKSKALLPKVEEDLPDLEIASPEDDIRRRLAEFKLFKEMSGKLKELENVDRYYKKPEPSAKDFRIVYKDFNLEGLIKAFSNLLSRVELEKEVHAKKEIPKEVFTVQDKMIFIRETLLERKECSFFELFKSTASRAEVVTTFQAMLELLKRQFIKVEQQAVFDDITITINEERSDDLGEFGDLSEYN